MLKIKSNTNEFTIIFSEKIRKKINAEKFSVPALSFFLLQRLFLLFFSSGQRLSFAFQFRRSLTFLQPSLFSFLLVALYFSAQNTFFSAQTFFSPNVFASIQPLFSSSFFCFILFWLSPPFSLSAPPFFLFFSSVYPRPNILSSCFKSLLFE